MSKTKCGGEVVRRGHVTGCLRCGRLDLFEGVCPERYPQLLHERERSLVSILTTAKVGDREMLVYDSHPLSRWLAGRVKISPGVMLKNLRGVERKFAGSYDYDDLAAFAISELALRRMYSEDEKKDAETGKGEAGKGDGGEAQQGAE